MARTRIFRTTATAQDAQAEPLRRKLPDRAALAKLSPTPDGTSTAANVYAKVVKRSWLPARSGQPIRPLLDAEALAASSGAS